MQQEGPWAVITEWDDGTVAATLVTWPNGTPMLTPSVDQLQEAAWRVACSVEGELIDGVLDVDKERIHNCSTERSYEGIEFRVGDDAEDGYDTIYVRAMGRVSIR
jgi:hypothetical protein